MQYVGTYRSEKFAAAAWDTSNKEEITGLEQVQNQAVRFIAGLKGTRGISETMAKLGLLALQQRRKQLLFKCSGFLPRKILSLIYNSLIQKLFTVLSPGETWVKHIWTKFIYYRND